MRRIDGIKPKNIIGNKTKREGSSDANKRKLETTKKRYIAGVVKRRLHMCATFQTGLLDRQPTKSMTASFLADDKIV